MAACASPVHVRGAVVELGSVAIVGTTIDLDVLFGRRTAFAVRMVVVKLEPGRLVVPSLRARVCESNPSRARSTMAPTSPLGMAWRSSARASTSLSWHARLIVNVIESMAKNVALTMQ